MQHLAAAGAAATPSSTLDGIARSILSSAQGADCAPSAARGAELGRWPRPAECLSEVPGALSATSGEVELKWYLSQSGCGIKSGINTTFLARNCGSVSVAPELTMPPRRTGFNEYMPQGQRTLTEVDGVREAGLEEPGASAANGGGIDMNVDVAEADIDNLNAGGFFARYGREPNGPSPTVIPPHTPGGEP